MRSRKRRLYWDSNCFIALFNSEPTTPPLQLDGLRATFEEMLEGKLKIVTGDIYKAEVFGKKKPAAHIIGDQFEACPDFEIVPLRTQAYEMAGQMRERCNSSSPPRKLKLGDALHVAAGTIARVDEVWTTDAKLVSYHEDGLLTSVKVCLPYLLQLRLMF